MTDNVDQNLGYKTFLNGAPVSDIMIDASAAATDTIDYVATNNTGNTATSTRSVIVEAPAYAAPPQIPPDAASSTNTNRDDDHSGIVFGMLGLPRYQPARLPNCCQRPKNRLHGSSLEYCTSL